MDNVQETNVTVEAPVANNVDTKVTIEEAQRKTAITIEGMFACFEFLVGVPLLIVGAILLAKLGGWSGSTRDGLSVTPEYATNSYFAMIIVGAFLTIEAILSTIFTMEMQIKNKTDHVISNTLAGWTFLTLNPASFNMVRRSNGWLSRKDKKKLAKKQAAAASTDSVDTQANN